MSYPNLIDPEVFVAEGQNLQGSFLLEELMNESVRTTR